MEWTQLICCTLHLFIYFLGLIQGNICHLCLSGCLRDPWTTFQNKTPPYCLALRSRAQVHNPVRHLECPAVGTEAGKAQTPGDLMCATRISSRCQALTWLGFQWRHTFFIYIYIFFCLLFFVAQLKFISPKSRFGRGIRLKIYSPWDNYQIRVKIVPDE